jgi:hypothetical protein
MWERRRLTTLPTSRPVIGIHLLTFTLVGNVSIPGNSFDALVTARRNLRYILGRATTDTNQNFGSSALDFGFSLWYQDQ